MIDLAKLKYRVVIVTRDEKQLDVSDVVSGLGWSEGEKELGAKTTLKLANADYDGKNLWQMIQPLTQIIIYVALDGEDFQEAIRGNVSRLEFVESSRDFYLQVEAADEAQALRHNEDDFYFTDGHSAKQILEKVLGEWQVKNIFGRERAEVELKCRIYIPK